MGVDYLDLTLRTERVFRIKISREQSDAFLKASVVDRDFTAGQWFDFVWALRNEQYPQPPPGGDWPCLHCGYNLRGLAIDAKCPECGRRSDQEAAWKAMQRVYRNVLGRRAREVGRQARMVRDLGFS